jgi:hypothetical protein
MVCAVFFGVRHRRYASAAEALDVRKRPLPAVSRYFEEAVDEALVNIEGMAMP